MAMLESRTPLTLVAEPAHLMPLSVEPAHLDLTTHTTTVCHCPQVHSQIFPSRSKQQQLFLDAVRNNDLFTAEKLVSMNGCNVNMYDSDGQTALTRGCFNGDLKLVKFLVGLGADLRLSNRAGWSCLHIAAFVGNFKLMSYLIRTLKEQKDYDYDVIMDGDDVIIAEEADIVDVERCLTPPPDL